jgi:FdhD protein
MSHPHPPDRTAAPARSIRPAEVLTVDGRRTAARTDSLVVEEPLEIRVAGPGAEPAPVAVTMRTPGHDAELATGFLLTEGVVASADAIVDVRFDVGPLEEQHGNVVTVQLTRPFDVERLQRHFFASSSCGVCGKATLRQLEVRCGPVADGPTVDAAVIAGLPARLRAGQALFEATGGLHAAGLFEPDGTLVALREDVGRHNAVDKLVGWALVEGRLPLSGVVLLVSGRVSFEIVQKAAMAGIPIVAAVSAPSSLAVEVAEGLGMTLVGFVREGRFNVYAGPERVRMAEAPR